MPEVHRAHEPFPVLLPRRRIPPAGDDRAGLARTRRGQGPRPVHRGVSQLHHRLRETRAGVDAEDGARMALPADTQSEAPGEPLPDPGSAYFRAPAPLTSRAA